MILLATFDRNGPDLNKGSRATYKLDLFRRI